MFEGRLLITRKMLLLVVSKEKVKLVRTGEFWLYIVLKNLRKR